MKLLYFYMKGCKSCKQQDDEFNKHKPDVDILKFDVDDVDTIRLCKKLHVGDVPTLILMSGYDSTMDKATLDKNFMYKWVDFTETIDINKTICTMV